MRVLSLLLMPALLLAQRPNVTPEEAFDRDLRRSRLGTWLVLEDDGAAWGSALQSALNEEPLLELNLPVKVVSGGKKADALAPILRGRYGWTRGAHWALVNASGWILVERTLRPTVSAVVSAVEQSGVRSRSEELEAFLRQHPEHLDAQMALLLERVLIANRRTSKALGPPPAPPKSTPPPARLTQTPARGGPSPAPATSIPVPAVQETVRVLDAEGDLRIWGKVHQQLERLLQGRWQETGSELGMAVGLAAAAQSPSMGALMVRYRGEIEEGLQRRPGSTDIWSLWLGASKACGGWPLLPLLQTLRPRPGTPPSEWPPVSVLNVYIRDAKARRDWQGIRGIIEFRWEEIRSGDSQALSRGAPYLWNTFLSPLVEALVSLGDTGSADQVLGEALGLDNAIGIPGLARDLAIRLNRSDLAARWGALMPKG